ncbi:MAG: hypothetical protein AAB420_01460 [Patescibacteria group bacterium]
MILDQFLQEAKEGDVVTIPLAVVYKGYKDNGNAQVRVRVDVAGVGEIEIPLPRLMSVTRR